MRPSDMAALQFDIAKAHTSAKDIPEGLRDTLNHMIQGLDAMNTGLRATYIKLEEIERLIIRSRR